MEKGCEYSFCCKIPWQDDSTMVADVHSVTGKANVLGVQIDIVRLDEVLAMIQETVAAERRLLIAHTNVLGINIAYQQAWFREFFNSADLVYCDGMGVQLGGRLLGYAIPERFTLADWVWRLSDLAEKNNFSMFLLGNPPGTAEKAAGSLKKFHPRLTIAGTQHGFFDKTAGHPENEMVLEQINTTKPDILLVGFGMPVQEKWLKENWPRLEVNVAITCGALFEYVAGDLPRGPRWMTQNYLEWLARLLISPRRYWKRYLIDNPLFLVRVFRQKLCLKP
jgi:N-acetylglucosaminyldiphosphoundecaprenol N-acetyl-beta-D-mannosaminyltransferase